MKTLITLSLPLLTTALVGQAPTAPAQPADLAKFDRLLGTWDGAGTVEMGGGQTTKWTSTSTIERILGGAFVRDTTVIRFGDAMPADLQFTTIIGVDMETKRFRQFSISNMGEVRESEIHWSDDDTYSYHESGFIEGNPTIDRWITKIRGDGTFDIMSHMAHGAGPFQDHVRGTMTRRDTVEATARKDGAFPVPGTSPEMKRLARMCGTYDVNGEMVMGPGQKMAITGVQTMEPIYGGTIVEFHTVGKPDYEAFAWMAWDPRKASYTMAYVSSMGEMGTNASRWVGNDLVSTVATNQMGTPVVKSSISRCDESGACTEVWAHTILGSGDPLKSFTATYARR